MNLKLGKNGNGCSCEYITEQISTKCATESLFYLGCHSKTTCNGKAIDLQDRDDETKTHSKDSDNMNRHNSYTRVTTEDVVKKSILRQVILPKKAECFNVSVTSHFKGNIDDNGIVENNRKTTSYQLDGFLSNAEEVKVTRGPPIVKCKLYKSVVCIEVVCKTEPKSNSADQTYISNNSYENAPFDYPYVDCPGKGIHFV